MAADFVMPSTACLLPTYTAAVGPRGYGYDITLTHWRRSVYNIDITSHGPFRRGEFAWRIGSGKALVTVFTKVSI